MPEDTLVAKARKLTESGEYETAFELLLRASFTEAAGLDDYHNDIADALIALSEHYDDPRVAAEINRISKAASAHNLGQLVQGAGEDMPMGQTLREVVRLAQFMPKEVEKALDELAEKYPVEVSDDDYFEIFQQDLPYFTALYYERANQPEMAEFYMDMARSNGHEVALDEDRKLPPPAYKM